MQYLPSDSAPNTTSIPIRLGVFAQPSRVADRQTDRRPCHGIVDRNRPHLKYSMRLSERVELDVPFVRLKQQHQYSPEADSAEQPFERFFEHVVHT